jgi:hypothetical protein
MLMMLRKLNGLTWRQIVVLVIALALVYWAWVGSHSGLASAVLPVSLLLLLLVALLLMAVHLLSLRISNSVAHICEFQVSTARYVPNPVTKENHEPAMKKVGAEHFYAKTNAKKLNDLVQQLVLDRSVDGRNILAYLASRGTCNFNEILVALEVFRSPAKRRVMREKFSRCDSSALLALARVLYRQNVLVSDRLNAITLFELVSLCFGKRALEAKDREWLVLALIQEQLFEEAECSLESYAVAQQGTPNYGLIQANLTNPAVRPGADLETWLRWLNSPYRDAGFEPIALRQGQGSEFQRLHCEPTTRIEGGPLLSVIMPVYCADEAIDMAIASILGQSWRRLELIIVDDGSPSHHLAPLERWVAADPRVRLIRCEQNRGTYTARNIGLGVAQGEFVTCHDGDDWSHPRKLQMQVEDLLANPSSIANLTRWVRVEANMQIYHRNPGPELAHPAYVSLMFRREPVVERLGCWDAVRKMGDAEFLQRMELVFEQEIRVIGAVPMSFSLQSSDSLSGSDMLLGYMAPERMLYLTRYREWHVRLVAGQASPRLEPKMKKRPFFAPGSFLPAKQAAAPFDVIYVSELGFSGGNAHSLVHEMTIAAKAGLRIGLVRVRNLLFTHLATRETIPELTKLVTSGAVTEIALTTPAQARLVIVRWPACFQYMPGVTSAIRAERTVIVANHPPYEGYHNRCSYEMEKVSRNVCATFGVEPEWSPQSATIRTMLQPQLPQGRLLDIDWVGVLSEEPHRVQRRVGPIGLVPVIGRHSRDHLLKWPESREKLLQVYPADGSVKVRVLGGVEHVMEAGALLPEDIAQWEVHGFNAVPPTEFLRDIDFFVYYHHKDWIESFGRVIMEAMFAGAVVVLPPKFQMVFGDSALYAEFEDVQQLIHRYHADQALFQAQSERGLAYAYANCTPSAYVQRLERLGISVDMKITPVAAAGAGS